MSNWPINKLTVRGNQKDLEFFKKVAAGKDSCFDLERFIPMPEHVSALPADETRIIPPWYAWQLRHWGDKWGVDKAKVILDGCADRVLTYEFYTPWSPPENALHEISRQFSTLEFELQTIDIQMPYSFFGYWNDRYHFTLGVGHKMLPETEDPDVYYDAFNAATDSTIKSFQKKVALFRTVRAALKAPKERTTLKELLSTLDGSAESKEYIHELLRDYKFPEEVIPKNEEGTNHG